MMRVRDIRHALELSKALHRFARALRDDDPPDEGGMTDDETCKALTFARALEATFDDVVRRERGFTLIEVLVSTTLAMMVVGALSVVLLHSAKLAATLSKVAYDESQARARIARQLVDLSTRIEGVTVTLDASTPEDATCRLYHVTTSMPSGRIIESLASKGCINQP